MDRFGAMSLLDALAKLRNSGRHEDAWRLMEGARQESELSGRGDRFSDGFSGAVDGEVIDAPWRGTYDMPGNFERGQRMANSMANDALLDSGLSYEYEYQPGDKVEAMYHPFSHAPGNPAMQQRWMEDFGKPMQFSGPPDTGKMALHSASPGNWDPTWNWVEPGGPPTRESFFSNKTNGRERTGSTRFKDWIWDSINRRGSGGFRMSPYDMGR